MSYAICKNCKKKFFTTTPKKFCTQKCLKEYKIKQKYKLAPQDQICWNCKNSCGKCRWSAMLKPIKNWEAEPIMVAGNPSYDIKFCPEYSPEYEQ